MSQAAGIPANSSAARRRYPRYELSAPFVVTIFRPGGVARFTGRSQELGGGGLRGVLSGAVANGERVDIDLQVPALAQTLAIHAVVRHQHEVECGFEFLNLESEQRELLQGLGHRARPPLRKLNGAETDPGAPLFREGGTVLCPSCGYEYADNAAFCVMCGMLQASPPPVEQIVPRHREPIKQVVKSGLWALTVRTSSAIYRGAAARKKKGALLDSVVALLFLLTLSIGLWQWLRAPADDRSQSDLQTWQWAELMRPAPSPPPAGRVSAPGPSSSSSRGNGSRLLDWALAPVQSYSARQRREPIGQPGSAEAPTQAATVSRPTVSLSSIIPSMFQGSASPEQPGAGPLPTRTSSSYTSPSYASAYRPGGSAASSEASNTGPSLQDLVVEKVMPLYPASARRQHVQGEVVLQAVIGKDGSILELRSLQGPSVLSSAAISAVRQWRFKPYEVKGEAVPVQTDIHLSFALPSR